MKAFGVFFTAIAVFMIVSGWLILHGDAGQDPVFVQMLAGCISLIGAAAAVCGLSLIFAKET
tara:strand:+ start:2886 stop:3071 length:186 start_codon:yes stop_codon:yes gene_type:complete